MDIPDYSIHFVGHKLMQNLEKGGFVEMWCFSHK